MPGLQIRFVPALDSNRCRTTGSPSASARRAAVNAAVDGGSASVTIESLWPAATELDRCAKRIEVGVGIGIEIGIERMCMGFGEVREQSDVYGVSRNDTDTDTDPDPDRSRK